MITFITRGHVDLELDGKTVTIQGEALFRTGPDTTDFVAYRNSITHWNDGMPVTESDEAAIIRDLIQSGKDRGLIIEVD